MSTVLSGLVVVLGLVTSIWSVVLFALARRADNVMLVVLLAFEVLLLLQLVVAIVMLAAGHRPDEPVTFVAYAAAELLILPAGVFWSAADKSRTSVLVIFIACFAEVVMTARMFQIWSSVSG